MSLQTDPHWSAVPYPAFLIDAQDRIVSCNAAAENQFSMSLRQMQRKTFPMFVGTDSPILESIAQTRAGIASVVQYAVDIAWGDRPGRTFTLHVSAVQDGSEHTLLLFHPTSIASQMDRSLAHRSAARSVTGMAAMLAHEIRNPLAGISGAAQLLSMQLGDDEQELTTLIQGEATRIGNLVERVEAFGDLRPTQRLPVNIHDVLDRAKRAAHAGYAQHIRFSETYDPSLPPTVGDFDQLLQVFQNLLKNSAEACPQVGGMIKIRTGYQPGVKLSLPGRKAESLPLLVSIVDNGSGIPETLIRDVFDPFVSSKANGSGLGLSLVSKVMSDHGGVVEVDSQPGRTEFRVRLPIASGGEAGTNKEAP
ncbi:MAG: ATP-binding protein [Pseudomonadota bacterium]